MRQGVVPPITINMTDGNCGIVREYEPRGNGTWVITFDRFCTPQTLLVQAWNNGDVLVSNAATLREMAEASGERGWTLEDGWKWTASEFTIDEDEARRLLWALELVEDRVVECTDCNGSGDHMLWDQCRRCGGLGCGECCDGAIQVPEPCPSCGGEMMVPESIARGWSR